jgi:tetratricopeptide (TPR) repeat protein
LKREQDLLSGDCKKIKMKIPFLLFLMLLFSFCANAQPQAQAAFSEGVKLLKENKFAEAEQQFTIAIEKGSAKEGIKMAWIYKGFARNGQQRYTDAVRCFDKAIEIDPLDAASYTDRGLAYSFANNYDKALSDFARVLKLDSAGKQARAAYYYSGKIRYFQGRFEESIRCFDSLLLLAPEDAEGYFIRGNAKGSLMDSKGAIADYTLAIQNNPSYKEAYANRGVEKINLLPAAEKIGLKEKCLPDPCADLKKAKAMGDAAVDDMLFLYCSDCK